MMKWLRKIWSWIESKKTPTPPAPAPSFPEEQVPSTPPVVGEKALWVPWAIRPNRAMPTSFTYPKGYPHGAVVHFTAGRDKTEQEALDSYNWGCDSGFTFFVIGPTGKLYQGFPLNKGGAHAGQSYWPGLGSGVSSKLVGIEVACAGKLDKNGKSWFGVTYPKEEIRNGFKKYTPEQEESLIKLLVWLKKNCPEVFDVQYIVGHNEVSPGRKDDPGYSLSMTMPELREKIKLLTAE